MTVGERSREGGRPTPAWWPDLAAAALATVFLVLVTGQIEPSAQEQGLDAFGYALLVAAGASLALCRRRPVAVLTVVTRTIALARELGIPRVALVGNRGRNSDKETFEAFARQHHVELFALIPEDGAVVRADRLGACVLDREPQAPAVQAIEALAEMIAGSAAATGATD